MHHKRIFIIFKSFVTERVKQSVYENCSLELLEESIAQGDHSSGVNPQIQTQSYSQLPSVVTVSLRVKGSLSVVKQSSIETIPQLVRRVL